jgi:methyltransferase (TIGR00027 family)
MADRANHTRDDDDPSGAASGAIAITDRSRALRWVPSPFGAAPPVTQTALWTAAVRDAEANRKAPLIHDRWAARLCGPNGLAIGRALEREGRAHDAIVVRTRIVDERIATAVVVDGIHDVLVLGAGLDARSLRLSLPHRLRWIEVDFPATIAWKAARLTEVDDPGCVLRLVPLDLTELGAVEELLVSCAARRPLLVVLEGVLPYLEPDVADALVRAIAARPATSIVADVGGGAWSAAAARRTGRVVASHGAPFLTKIDDAATWFSARGFEIRANVSLVDWDQAQPEPRFRRPWTARLLPGYRDAARVVLARSSR